MRLGGGTMDYRKEFLDSFVRGGDGEAKQAHLTPALSPSDAERENAGCMRRCDWKSSLSSNSFPRSSRGHETPINFRFLILKNEPLHVGCYRVTRSPAGWMNPWRSYSQLMAKAVASRRK